MTTDTTMTDVDTDEWGLLPCPFCGHTAPVPTCIDEAHGWRCDVVCRNCYAHGPSSLQRDDEPDEDAAQGRAMKYWNARPTETALSSRCDELERLAGDAHELIDQILGELDEAPIGPHKVELALLCERLKAYQRKGE